MRAVIVSEPGGPEGLGWAAVPDPQPGPGEILIDIAAAGVNRADLMQSLGKYPPPPGAPETLGLECAGTVVAIGPDADDASSGSGPSWQPGDRVCALLSGGGYAEKVAVPVGQVLPVPEGMSLTDAAGLPEVVCTVWSNLVMVGGLRRGQTLLVHGGSSGIGTMAIQIARQLGARVLVTASTQAKLDACREWGADGVINYTQEDFVARVVAETGGRGADLILDVVGADYLSRNIEALADSGRLVIIGLMGGARAEINLRALMGKRVGVIGTTLRSRPATGPGSKAEIVAAVRRDLWPAMEAGAIRPVIGFTAPMDRATDAHRALLSGDVIGKAVLTRPA